MERTELFRSDLFKKSNVGTTKQRDDALNQILQERKNDPQGILFSNKGCSASKEGLNALKSILALIESESIELKFCDISSNRYSIS